MKILLIDDDLKYAGYLAKDLENKFKHTVTWLKAPDNALTLLKELKFDAVILDIMMPVPDNWGTNDSIAADFGMSTGIVLYNKIRDVSPDLPILIYSAKEVEVDPRLRTRILRKPALNQEINDMLESILKIENNEK
jgi:CheY-like chemotaxis protein